MPIVKSKKKKVKKEVNDIEEQGEGELVIPAAPHSPLFCFTLFTRLCPALLQWAWRWRWRM